MTSMKGVAAVVNLVNSVWAIILAAAGLSMLTLPLASFQGGGLAGWTLMVVAVILLLDSIVCFIGFRMAFYLASILSALVLITLVATGNPGGNGASLLGIVISAVAIVLDVLASRSRFRMPEQIHPLNLPVFG